MFGVFSKQRDPWEELYDAETNTYFYRHRGTGEFSRTNPFMIQLESTSQHVAPKTNDPIWETLFDPTTGEAYYTDIETGKVCFVRPEKGTFVSELPLREFRRANRIESKKSRQSSRTTRPSTKSMRIVKRDDDFGIVSGDTGDFNFEELFGAQSPAQFDAGAMLAIGGSFSSASSASPSSPKPGSAVTPKPVETRRLSTRDGGETPDFPVLDEAIILAQSSIATDNPLFGYGK